MKIEEIKHEELSFCYRFHFGEWGEDISMRAIIQELENLEVSLGGGIRFLVLYDGDGIPEAVDFYYLKRDKT